MDDISSTHLFRGNGVLLNTPAMAEAVGKLEDGEDKLALSCASFLHTGLQSELLNRSCVRSCRRQMAYGTRRVRLTAPTVPTRYQNILVTARAR